MKEYWKAYNIKKVIDNISDAWEEVSTETLKKSWNKLWPESTELPSPDTNEVAALTDEILVCSPAFNLENNEIDEWLQCDSADVGYQLLTDDEIIEQVIEDESFDSETDDAEYDGSEPSADVPTATDLRQEAKQAVSNMQKFIEWYEQQPDANHIDTMLLRKFRIYAAKKSEASIKQSKLTDHFLHTYIS